MIFSSDVFLFSAEKPFYAERMITDYRGIVSNGKRTIFYGDYGIMTYTFDSGKSWDQQSIGDKYNIMKIISDGKEFYGVTDCFMFRSYNHDSYWLQQSISNSHEVIDMTLFQNSIYVLMKRGILKSDFDMNFLNLINLDTNSIYSELSTDGDNLYFIADSRYLQRYNLSTARMDTIDVIDSLGLNYKNTLLGLKVENGNIYILLGSIVNGVDSFYYELAVSTNNGDTWIKIANNVFKGKCYKAIGNDIFYLKALPRYHQSDSMYSYLGIEFSKIDSSHYAFDSTYFKIINKDDGIDRFIRITNKRRSVTFNDFIMNEDTIIAAGVDKMIAVSYNGGLSFKFLSFFDVQQNGTNTVFSFPDEENIYALNGFEVYKSTNLGITWLPQKFDNYNINIYGSPWMYYFGKDGTGFTKFSFDTTFSLTTNDFGETFKRVENSDLNNPIDNVLIGSNGIELEDVIVFAVNSLTDSSGKKSYMILRYDKNFKLLDTIKYSGDLRSITQINNNELISLNLIASGLNRADSIGHTDTYSYYYFLRKTTDKGATWDSINIEVPIRQKLNNSMGNYYFSDIITTGSIIYNDNIIFPTTNNKIYKYNYKENSFDSLYLPANLLLFHPYAISKSFNGLFITSNVNFKTYYADISKGNNALWDSLAPEDMFGTFGHWNNFDQFAPSENKDAILYSHKLNDSLGFIVLGKSYKSLFGTYDFQVNIAKINFLNMTNVKDFQVEANRSYLWHSNPYPLPAKNIVKSDIYWTKSTPIENIQINIFDINGAKLQLKNKKISLDRAEPYSGTLTWDCSDINSGIFIIQIELSYASISFPVVVTK